MSETIDIVVPVYGGLEESRACLESLLEHGQETPFEIIVVNDASPDAALAAYVEELSGGGKVTLLTNEANIGFVGSANLGMMMHPDRDVVLLNSDTEVNGDWLDRLRRCAKAHPKAGTVTPFSNNATICSYPRFLEDNPLPAESVLAELDDLFAEVNRGRSILLPTAIGFCTYITRRCLDTTGYLDSMHFGRGYGEENDFSIRAAIAGFEHRLCGDVFVYHAGGASFGDEAASASDAAQETLRRRHPQYEPLIHSHFREDPARELRRRVDIARLAASKRRRLMLVTHRLGGGTEKFVRELAGLLEPELEVLIMRPRDMDCVGIEWARTGEEFNAFFNWPRDYGEMVGFLKDIGVERLHFHHLVEYGEQVLRLPADLGVAYDFSIHDYYSICPLYNLISTDGRYCGEPDAAGCAVCLSEHEALAGLDIDDWRGRWAGLISGADRVIVPSNDVSERLRRYFPEANFVYLPHPEAEEVIEIVSGKTGVDRLAKAGGEIRQAGVGAGQRRSIKVLVLGELSVAKGARLLEACAADAAARELPLNFRVLGWAREKLRQEPEIPLFIMGPYDDSQLDDLIERERADIIFFPALWPETYSYTLSAAMRSGLAVAAPRLGAFSERLDGYPGALLMEWDTEAADWNDLFMSQAGQAAQRQPDRSEA
ncbi:MAG: glycosyltransferase [Actinobacteria bacterium]|nr:glycosyltransferase [Actinomycetota bacterium]